MLAAVLTGELFRLIMLDRSGAVLYDQFDIHKEPGRSVRNLCFLCTAEHVALGFDPTVKVLRRTSRRTGKELAPKSSIILSDCALTSRTR